MDTDQTSTEQTCGRTDQNGKTYAQHRIGLQWQKVEDQHLGQGYDKRHNQPNEKHEMVLTRVHQPPQIRPMDNTCYNLETIKDDKGDQPSGGETTWANTEGSRSGREHPKTGRGLHPTME